MEQIQFHILTTTILQWIKYNFTLQQIQFYIEKQFECTLEQIQGLWTLTFLQSKWEHLQSQSWSNIERLGQIQGNVSELMTTHGGSPHSVNKLTNSTCKTKPSGD